MDDSQRKLVWRGIELLSLLPVIGLGIRSAFLRDSYTEAVPQQLAEVESTGTEVSLKNLLDALRPVKRDADALYDEYKEHYYKTEVYVTVDSKGHSHMHTRHYWDVPGDLPEHDVVEEWDDASSQLCSKIEEVYSQPVVSASEDIAVVCRTPNFWGKLAITCAVYGPLAVGLLGYEEALEHLEIIRHAERDMSRRNFLKLIAAAGGIVPAVYFQDRHEKQSDAAMQRVSDAVSDIVAAVKTKPSEEIFSEVLGYTSQQLYNFVSDMHAQARDGASKECALEVQEDFTALMQSTSAAQQDLETLMPERRVPAELDMPLRHFWGCRKLGELNSSERVGAYTNPLSECAVIAGIVGAVAAGNEVLMQKGL